MRVRVRPLLQLAVARLDHDALGAHLAHGMVPEGVVAVDHHALERRCQARPEKTHRRRAERTPHRLGVGDVARAIGSVIEWRGHLVRVRARGLGLGLG